MDTKQSVTALSTAATNGSMETTSAMETETFEKALEEYEKENHILYTFTDGLVSFRFFMSSETTIHQVCFVGDITQAVLIPRDKIARIDQTDLGELVSVTITDTSGKTITGTLSKEDAKAFLNELQTD